MARAGDRPSPTTVAVRVLGDVGVAVDGWRRPLGRQSRRLLACLALNPAAGSAGALAESLHLDGRGESAVRMAVSRLRRHLGDRLCTGPTGYRLVLGPADVLDVDRFAGELAAGRAITGTARVEWLQAALRTWSGVPAAEFADEPWAIAVVAHWQEQRRQAVEELAEALLEDRRPTEATMLLAAELDELPYRERPVELLMRALAASGRTTEALRAFARFRSGLADDIGIEPSAALSRLERSILDGNPAHSTMPARRLDNAPTSFVGRIGDVAGIAEAARGGGLVTLTGVGGVGKSRLALHVAAVLSAKLDGDVHVVELAPVSEPDAVALAVAGMLGVIVRPDVAVVDSLVTALDGRRMLLVLDNCEHQLDAAATVVEALLARTGIWMMATSREVLHVPGERRWPVEPLAVADEAVELFVDRARSVRPAFSPSAEDLAVVGEICAQLDGIPLAIELAAARMTTLSVADLLERLDDRFRLLVGSRRGPARHRTLQDAVAWSFDLLGPAEVDALRRASVFAGGFDLAAAAAVLDVGDEYAALDLLDALAGKSLLVAELRGGARFRMLETIRQFVAPRLVDDAAAVRRRHARHYAEGVRACVEGRRGTWIGAAWVEREIGNLRAAFEWSRASGDVETAASIAADSVHAAWNLHHLEPLVWVDELLASGVEMSAGAEARLRFAASHCIWIGQPDRALEHLDVVETLPDFASHELFEGQLLSLRATAHLFAGRVDRAAELDGALAASPRAGRLAGMCGLLYELPELGRFDEALAIADEVVAAARAAQSPFLLSWALTGFARAAASIDPAAGLAALYEGLELSRTHLIRVAEAVIARDAARLEGQHGSARRAGELYEYVFDAFLRAGDSSNLAVALGDLAVVVAAELPEPAAVLVGAARRDPAAHRVRDLVATVDALGDALGSPELDALARRGASLSWSSAVAYGRSTIECYGVLRGGDHASSATE
ncbi:MAG: BTAD domain-containing putative transcriptional regulator [Ilumatobacteraceae bacterium]